MKSDLQTSVGLTARMPYRLGFKAAVAGVCASESDLDTSYRLLLECLLLNPNFIPAQETIAVNRLLASEPVIALREFKNVLRTNPSSRVGLWGKGLTLCILGRHEDALDIILEMAENQEMSGAGSSLLKRYFGIEETTTLKVSSMVKSFTENLSSNKSKTAFDLIKDIGQSDQSARLKLMLSDLLFSRGERKTAKNLLEKMLDVHPYYPGLLYKLARTSKS
ncbi:MAG: tetratricopeptide repeat protein, partial [Caldisericales bacterium]